MNHPAPPPGGAPPGEGGGGGRRRRRRGRGGGGGGPRPETAEGGAQQAQARGDGGPRPERGPRPEGRPPERRDGRDRGGPPQRGRGPEGGRGQAGSAGSSGGRPQGDRRPQHARGEQGDRRPQPPRGAERRPHPEQPRPAPSTAAALPSVDEGGVLVAPSAALDAGWGALAETPVAAAPIAEVVAAPPPPPPEPVLPPDPDGEEVFRIDGDAANDVAGYDLSRLPRGKLTNVAGVKYREAGTIHELDAGETTYKRGDRVLVDTERGQVIATVAVGSRRMSVGEPLRRIARLASAADDRARERLVEKEREAYLYCKQRAREQRMPIKVVRCEYPLTPGGRVLFYFAAEDRIDFRELVRDLGARLRARIEMRQIGARDEAKMVGGIGSCGRELCCTTFLPAFVPVSIKMAKDQGLVLNPTKVSGQCGRLKCCLVYEQDTYKEMRKGLPKVGKRVETPAGNGKVVELDVLRQRVRVWFDEGGSETFPADVVRRIEPPPQPGRRASLPVVTDSDDDGDEPEPPPS